MNAADIARLNAACVVADRAHLAEASQFCTRLGGAWHDGVAVWERHPQFNYLVLLADSVERIERRTPLIVFVADEFALSLATQAACSRLVDVTCAWIRFLEPKANEAVGAIMLADAAPAGHA